MKSRLVMLIRQDPAWKMAQGWMALIAFGTVVMAFGVYWAPII